MTTSPTPRVEVIGSGNVGGVELLEGEGSGSATAQPQVPAAPTGEVTVTGRAVTSEGGAGAVDRRDGKLEIRRIGVSRIARELPYPVAGGYVLLDQQTPAADPAFQAVPIGHTNNWQNFGYVVQWWLFAGMSLVGYAWVARREAHRAAGLALHGPRLDRPGGRHGPGRLPGHRSRIRDPDQ